MPLDAVPALTEALKKVLADTFAARASRLHARPVCDQGFNKSGNAFTHSFGRRDLDASLLLIPIVGFLPADDPPVLSTVAAIERELVVDGFVLRYQTQQTVDGLPPGEGVFLPCSFWLADNYILQNRHAEARPFSSACCPSATISVYRKSTIPVGSGRLAIFRKRFRIWL